MCIYNMGSKLDSFLRKKMFPVLFTSYCLYSIIRDNATKFTSVGLSYKDIILFSNILRVRCSLCKIKSTAVGQAVHAHLLRSGAGFDPRSGQVS